MTRHTTVLGLTALLALAAGCGSGAARDDSTLVISTWDAGKESGIDVAAEDFRRANPGVTVNVVKTPYDQHTQALRRQLTAGRIPDVATTLVGYGEAISARSLADGGLLDDLSGAKWAAEIPARDRYLTNDGERTLALPMDHIAIGVYYQPKVFAELTVPVPRTFADVLALCRRFAGTDRVAFAMGAQGAGMPHFVGYALAGSAVFAGEPDFSEQRLAGRTTFAASPGWRHALDQFTDMVRSGCFDKDATGRSREVAAQEFGRGRALMAVAPTVSQPLFQSGNPTAELAMFPFPNDSGPDGLRVTAGPATGLVVPKRAVNPDLAKRFLDLYAENRAKYSRVDNSIPGIPVGADPRVPAFAQPLDPYVSRGQTAPVMDQTWPSPEVLPRFSDGLVEIMLGTGTGNDVLAAMDSAWNVR